MTSSSNSDFWLVSLSSIGWNVADLGMWNISFRNNQPTIRAELIICGAELNQCKRDMVLRVAFDQISKSELHTAL